LPDKDTTEHLGVTVAALETNRRVPLPASLSSLREKLQRKAKQEPSFRFYALYDRISRTDVLRTAWEMVRINRGAAGVDHVTILSLEETPGAVEALLSQLQQELVGKNYRPLPIRRQYIPKADGRQRPLGIPAIRDRIVQAACLLILEPIFEADFLDCSFGFRPGRNAHQALRTIHDDLASGFTAVYDADLVGYFDSIPHNQLLKALSRRIADRSVLHLIRLFLEAPIQEREPENPPDQGKGPGQPGRPQQNGKTHHFNRLTKNRRGTPQGGVLSPLLANVYLHRLDRAFHHSQGPAVWAKARLVRYADDFLILARYLSPRLLHWLERWVEGNMGLKINRQKSRSLRLSEEGITLDFLGFTFSFRPDRYHRGGTYLRLAPSHQAVQRAKQRIRQLTEPQTGSLPLPDLIGRMNLFLSGWSGYFNLGYPKQAFRHIDWFVQCRLYRHLQRRSQRPCHFPAGSSPYHALQEMGLVYLSVPQFRVFRRAGCGKSARPVR